MESIACTVWGQPVTIRIQFGTKIVINGINIQGHFMVTHSSSMDLPILVVGAGPVGLALSLALTRQGVSVALFEADDELNSDIRASTFHPPTLEMLAEWGMLDELFQHGFVVNKLMYWERQTRQ